MGPPLGPTPIEGELLSPTQPSDPCPPMPKYKVFVKYYDLKLDIVLTHVPDSELKTLADIFDNMVQIFGLTLRKELVFKDFIFELTDSLVDNTVIINDTDAKIRHMSVITVRDRPKPLSLGRAFVSDPDIKFLDRKTRDIITFYLVVDTIYVHHRQTKFLKAPHRSWTAVYNKAKTHYPTIFWNTTEANQLTQLFHTLVDFYVRTYEKLNLKIEVALQKRFDMLKMVHLLTPTAMFTNAKKVRRLAAIAEEREIRDYVHLQERHAYDMCLKAHRMFRKSISFEEFIAKYIDNEPSLPTEIRAAVAATAATTTTASAQSSDTTPVNI